MLFITILTIAVFLCFFLYKKTRRSFLIGITIFLFIFLILEVSVYTYFVYQVYNAKGLLFIGNQPVLDTLYKIRLIYSVYYAKGKKDYVYTIDDELGYLLGRNKKTTLYTSNSMGMRGSREYKLISDKDTFRIITVGDSYVFCDFEKDEDTWTYRLENSVENLEVLNFGVSGYGVNQAYLRYLKDGLRFSPHIVLTNRVWMGFDRDATDYLKFIDKDLRNAEFYRVKLWTEDGILKHQALSVFDLFDPQWRNENIYDKLDFYKTNWLLPRKLLSFSNISLLLKVHYIKYKISKMPLRPEPDLLEINLKLLESFSQIAKQNNSILVFVQYGPLEEKFPEKIREFFENNKDHVLYFEIGNSFSEYLSRYNVTREDIMNHSRHYNAIGNEIYAKVILDILKNNEWDIGKKIFYYDIDSNSFLYRLEE